MSRELDAETQALLVVLVATGNTPQEDKWLVPGLLAGLAEKSGEFLAPVWRAVPLAVCFLEAGLQVSGVPSGPHLSGGGRCSTSSAGLALMVLVRGGRACCVLGTVPSLPYGLMSFS